MKVFQNIKLRKPTKKEVRIYFGLGFVAWLAMVGATLYQHYKIDKIIEQWKTESAAFQKRHDDFIDSSLAENPEAPSSIYYLLEKGRVEEAHQLMNKLIDAGNDEAIYGKAYLSLKSEYLVFDEEAIETMVTLCNQYYEPCLTLGKYYIEKRDWNLAYKYLIQAKETNNVYVYSELRYVHSVKSWEKYDPAKAKLYAKKMATANTCGGDWFKLTELALAAENCSLTSPCS